MSNSLRGLADAGVSVWLDLSHIPGQWIVILADREKVG
jgi:hypothetical protein